MKEIKNCESCLMPFSQDPVKTREDARYCSYCFVNGKLTYEGDFNGFKKQCYEGMTKDNKMNKLQAKFFVWMMQFAPRWKNKKD